MLVQFGLSFRNAIETYQGGDYDDKSRIKLTTIGLKSYSVVLSASGLSKLEHRS